MRLSIPCLLAVFAAPLAHANTCSYVLDQENYGEDMSGVLTFNGETYRCQQYEVGVDSITMCASSKAGTHEFEYVIGMDGGEAGFHVYKGMIEERNQVCGGTATWN